MHLENAISLAEPAAERGSVTVRFLDELAKEIDLADTAVRSAFSSSEADSEHYANAVVGRLACVPGVSASGTSGDPDFWLPWTGFREARSIIRGAPIARGTLSRNRFKFPSERAPDPMLLHRHGGGALPDPELVPPLFDDADDVPSDMVSTRWLSNGISYLSDTQSGPRTRCWWHCLAHTLVISGGGLSGLLTRAPTLRRLQFVLRSVISSWSGALRSACDRCNSYRPSA